MLGPHHVRARRRASIDVEPYPHPSFSVRLLDNSVYAAAFIAPLAFLPQVIEIFTTHNTSSLTLSTYVLLGSINVLWTIYAVVHRERPLLIANASFAVLDFAVVVAIFLFR